MANIGLDWSLVERNPLSGMGVYVQELYRSLKKNNRNHIQLITLTPSKSNKSLVGFVIQPLIIQIRLLWFVYRLKLKAVYVPNPPIPLFSPVPIILTIPDLSFIFDNTFSPALKLYLFVSYYISAHRAQYITTFSRNSVLDIVKYLKVDPKLITIATPAVKKTLIESSTQRSRKIILTVPGTFIPRKNVADVILAYRKLPKNMRVKYQLVCVGNTSDRHFASFSKHVIRNQNISFIGPISDTELLKLYQQSVCLMCTSLYEGFGLPLLEAMSNSVPVIAYNNSSLSEIVGGAGMLVDDVNDLVRGLELMLTDVKLRQSYIRAGMHRSRKYSWDKSAQTLAKIFIHVST